MRFFNTAGPVRAEDHYVIPPLKRRKFAEILRLIRNKQYFVLHAPRQTGLLCSSFDSSTVLPPSQCIANVLKEARARGTWLLPALREWEPALFHAMRRTS